MPQIRLEQQLEIVVACCALHNFSILHKNGIIISTKDSNVDESLNVQLCNDNNQIVMHKLKDEVAEIFSSPTVLLLSYMIHVEIQP